MIIFIRKAWRDVKSKKLRSIPIILVITIGCMITLIYSALYFNWLEIEESSWIDHKYHHLLITTKEMDKSNLTVIVNQIKDDLNVEIEFELREFHELQVAKSGVETQVATHVFAVREDELFVDKLYYHSGYLNTLHGSSEPNIAVVEKLTAEMQGWEINNVLEVSTPSGILNLTITAMVDSPEFLISPGIITEFYGRAMWDGPVIWLKNQDWNNHENSSNQANQIAFYFNDPSMVNDYLEEFLTVMSREYGSESVIQYSGRNPFLLTIAPTFSGLALILSFVFAMITGIMLFIVLKRIIEEEITTLGIFKALGFTNWEIISSAIIFTWVLGLLGGCFGVILGLIGGLNLGDFYIELAGIKRLPNVARISSVLLIIPALGIFSLILFFATVASLIACWRIVRMAPIDALRPQASFKSSRSVTIEKLLLKVVKLSPLTKFSIRSVFQEKRKASFIIFGIILATTISFFGSTTGMSFVNGIEKQFQFYQTWDAQITFNNLQNSTEIEKMLENLTWDHYEAIVFVPIRLQLDMAQNYVVTGLETSTQSRNFDRGGVPHYQNVVISKDLAIRFNLALGKNLTLYDVHGNERELKVENVLAEFTGGGLYTSIDTARWLLGITHSDYANGIYIHSSNTSQIEDILHENSNIQEIVIKSVLEKSVKDAMTLGFVFMLVAMSAGLIVGVAITVSVVSISISERKYDFANFRALGVSNREIFLTILFELVITSIVGILIGFISGALLSNFIYEWAAEFGVILILDMTFLGFSLIIINITLSIIFSAYVSLRSLFRSSISEETLSRIIG
ncbi:MAG: ABC transporter permease [Candidatus Heimdallarchaeota archaeon]|nr:ABC transporter permease [Candidatus Heimdallarchaeota archaeon]